ncbi:MAG: indole-3-glycerol-phosphate synthase [Actinobacteria bacterium]|nr:indole-3-glycerol-phosphate synthase [Actinomycetota bacterium]
MGFLTDKVADVRRSLERAPLDDAANMARALALPPARDFAAALRSRTPSVIAEVKRASPSAGAIAEERDPVGQARAYVGGGAAAVSVLTDAPDFGGSLADLRAVRTAVDLPLLRKDFLVHPSQLIEARAAGADAVLLISTCLSLTELEALLAASSDLGLGALVETHSDADLEKALAAGADVIGVNARDLESLDVDVDGALRGLGRIPPDRVAVMESGISTRAHVVAAVAAGASAILVGEALMRAPDPRAKLRELMGEGST